MKNQRREFFLETTEIGNQEQANKFSKRVRKAFQNQELTNDDLNWLQNTIETDSDLRGFKFELHPHKRYYKKLMNVDATKLSEKINSLGQLIEFYEHPYLGDEAQIIAVCKELEMACDSGFYDTDDMMAEHREYEPSFVDGCFFIGPFNQTQPC